MLRSSWNSSLSQRLVLVLGLIGAFSNTNLFAAATPTVSGSLGRGGAQASFTLTIKVSNIDHAATNPNYNLSGSALVEKSLAVYLPDQDSAKLPFTSATATAALPFYITPQSDPIKTADTTALDTYTYSITITESIAGSLKTLVQKSTNKDQLNVRVDYYEGDTKKSGSESIAIKASAAIVQAAPADFSVSASNQQITAKWNPSTTALFSDGTTASVSDVVMVAISRNTTLTDLPAYIYNSAAATDSAAPSDGCGFLSSYSSGASCVACDQSTYYLNPDQLANLKDYGVYTKTVSAATGAATINGLENDQKYAVFLFYQPGGLTQTSCIDGTPLKNSGLAELNGEDEAKWDNPRCFIATAAYGSPLHRNLKLFTWFRDNVLLKNDVGRQFVRWYYRHGPAAAEVVAAHPALALGVRTVLWVPALSISLWLTANANPELSTAVFAGLLAILAWIAARRRPVPAHAKRRDDKHSR